MRNLRKPGENNVQQLVLSTVGRHAYSGLHSLVIALLTASMAMPAWAAGTNTGQPNALATAGGPQVVPLNVTTSIPSLPYPPDLTNKTGCVAAYSDTLNALNQQVLDKQVSSTTAARVAAIGQAAEIVADGVLSAVEITDQAALSAGLGVTTAYGVAPAPTAAGIPGSVAAAAATAVNAGAWGVYAGTLAVAATGAAAGIASAEIQAQGNEIAQKVQNLNVYTSSLPQCETSFTGTVTVKNGGVNVTGNSLIDGNLGVTGNVTASQVQTTQGISAFGGAITIGDPGLTTYSSGITIGGGAISGAGTGGAQAFTGNVNAMAIGNGASAAQAGSLALGLNANAFGTSAVAVGEGTQALADQTVAIGYTALVSAAAGAGSFAGGTSAVLSGTGAVSIGNLNVAAGNGAIAIGDPNLAFGTGAVAVGADNTAVGTGAVAIGNQNFANGLGAIAQGNASSASADGSIAMGVTASASSTNAVALGTIATASGVNSTALGGGANAAGANATAVGTNANAFGANSTAVGANSSAGYANSTAVGQGATTTRPNQVVLGTSSDTVTAPGMNSDLSRGRQSGLLGIVTSDAYGNLASDNGALYKEVAGIKAGTAVAMSLSDPVIGPTERFGLKLNASTFDGANALGLSAAGVVARNLFHAKNQLTLSGAVGVGQASVFGYQRTMTGARGGVQFTW